MSENHYSRKDREPIFTQKVQAGRRTYFFDVKSMKSNDYFLTITESKKRTGDDGQAYFEKHKIFVYREDMDKFLEAFNGCMDKIQDMLANSPIISQPDNTEREEGPKDSSGTSSFTDVDFDDLK
jgi:hypothetical protein